MIASFADDIARTITSQLNDWLDEVAKERYENNNNIPNPPMVYYLGDGYTENINFDIGKPYIIVYINRITIKPFTFGTNSGIVNIRIKINDNININIMKTIDNIYKFVNSTLSSVNNKWSGTATVKLISNISVYYDSTEKELVNNYIVDLPIEIVIENPEGDYNGF